MIHIRQSRDADPRSATGKVTKQSLLRSSKQHTGDVVQALHWMARKVALIGADHDWTKIKHIDEFYTDFTKTRDGFRGDFKKMHWFKDLHLRERHHLNDYCPEDVTLFDCLERIADIVMAGMGRSGTVFDEDIDPAILSRAYANTIKLLKAEIQVDPDQEVV